MYLTNLMTRVQSKRSSIVRLKTYVVLQLEAYYQGDWEVYDRLEQKIRQLENELTQS